MDSVYKRRGIKTLGPGVVLSGGIPNQTVLGKPQTGAMSTGKASSRKCSDTTSHKQQLDLQASEM